jgi:hypothetical protein
MKTSSRRAKPLVICLFIPLFVTLCVNLDPGTHKGMNSVLA